MLLFPSVGKTVVEGIPCTPEPTSMIVNYGDLVNCQIDPVSDLDGFRFSGAAGEAVRVQTAKLGGPGFSSFEVFGPDGTLICFGGSTNCQLAQGGAHTILVSEGFNDAIVNYALALERIAPPSLAARPIDYSQVLSDEINGVGDIDAFVFTGGANDLVRVQTSKLGGPGFSSFEVFGPDGTLICFGGSTNCQLTQGGAHTILVSEGFNDATVIYSLTLECIVGVCPAPPPPPPAPPPAPPFEAEPATPQNPIPCRGSRCRVPIICNLQPDEGTPCVNRIRLLVRASSVRMSDATSTRAPRMIRFAFGVANVPPSEIKNVKLRLTSTGRRIVKMGKRRLRGVIEIRNTPGDLIDSTPVRIRIR